jgi:hypothetical protein
MKENIQNLIKNAIQENAVKFKDQASQVLYSKVGDRLKQEYINVSKSMFKNINEAVGALSFEVDASDEAMMAPPARGTGGSGTGPSGKPKDKKPSSPSRGPNPGPWRGGGRPQRGAFPPGVEGDNEYRKVAEQWYEEFIKWWQQNEAYQPGPDRPAPKFIDIFGFEQG